MRLVILDFETLFGEIEPPPGHPHLNNNYSLSVMSTESYVRDPRFEAHGAAIKWNAETPAQWYDERQLRWQLAQEDWSDVFLVAHHAQFDGLILSHHYGVHPRLWSCTLSMARLLLGNHISVSLDSVRKQFGFEPKSTPYHLFRGRHWSEIDVGARQQIADGACDEVESIWKLFGLLAKDFPAEEYDVVDATIKMFTKPVLRADIDLLAKVWQDENTRKQQRMAELNVNEADLQSAEKFAALLRQEGVEPEMKLGKMKPNGDEKQIYAFAKTDQFMRDLQEHKNERVQTLAEARLGAKSTLLQTRAETLGWAARRGAMPVYLRYCGAHTTRWSGGDGCLTADTRVLVFDHQKGLTKKRIVDILNDDLVWDGEDFVTHGGIAFSGYQEVIEHDGIRGTGDHIVFDVSGKEISLAKAARMGTRIMDCAEPDSTKLAPAWKRDSK